MNFQQLKFVVALAETKSFTSAADICCVTQPALSNSISQLETEFGSKLFERTTRSVNLTPFGEAVIKDMQAVLDAKSRLVKNVNDALAEDGQVLRIGLSPLINDTYITSLLSKLKTINNGMTPIVTEMNKDDILPSLLSGAINIGFGPEGWEDKRLETKLIYNEPLLYLSEAKPENGTFVSLEQLAHEQMLFVGEGCGLSTSLHKLFEINQIPLNIYEGRALSYSVLENWSQLGIGVALLPASKVDNLSRSCGITDRNGQTVSLSFHTCWLQGTNLNSEILSAL